MNKHEKYMNLAYKLALKARGATSPNPMVGPSSLKTAALSGGGHHHRAGLAHAEVIALDEAGARAQGATLYVTLEPCTHFGKTPPCVHKIIASGVAEVIVGMIDPNPLNNSKGVEILRQNKIAVRVGFLEEELRRLNEVFIKYITSGLPFVTVKVGQSLDGKIAARTGDSKWITSDKSRSYAHRLRGEFDAIMVGVNTIMRDNPRLSAWFTSKRLTKIVVDTQLSTPQNAALFTKDAPVILVTVSAAAGQETQNRATLGAKAKILEVREKDGQVNLKDMLKKLRRERISNILVEGGGTLIGSLFDEGLVDRVLFFIAPKIIGGKEAISSVMGQGISRVEKAVKLKDVKLKRIGDDFLVEGYVHRYY